MKPAPPYCPHARITRGARVAGLAISSLGCIDLAGWIFQIEVAKIHFQPTTELEPNSALAFILSGFALWLLGGKPTRQIARWVARACAAVVAIFGALVLCEYLLKWEAGFDGLLIKASVLQSQSSVPGRPAFLTALNFLFLGLGLSLIQTKGRYGKLSAELSSAAAILISLLALIGYSCNVHQFYGWRSVFPGTGMGILSLSIFTVLGAGVLCLRPEQGLMEIMISPTASGVMARRLMLAPVIIPLVTGLLTLAGRRTGIYNSEVASWLVAFLNIFVFTGAIWWCATLLYRAEIVRERTEEEVHKLN